MAPQSAPDDSIKREGLIARAVDWVFGYDFFLSYNHADGMLLPRRLKERIEQVGFRVFLDQTEYVAGADLRRETRRQVVKSRKIVVIGRPGALKSEWVKREVDVALAEGKIPVILNVNGAVEAAPPDAALATVARERHWLRLNETLDNPDGEPTDRTISELVRGFNHTRQETKRQRILATAAVVLAVAAGVAIWQAVEATKARMVAEAQRDRAQRVLDQIIATANRRVQTLSARVQKARATPSGGLVAAADETEQAESVSGSPLEQANFLIAHGSALLDRGDLKGARLPLESALAILGSGSQEMLAEAQWRLAIFKAYHRLAEAAHQGGDGEAGLAALTKGLAIAEEETGAKTASLGWQQRLAVTHQRIGELLLKKGSGAEAEPHCREAVALWRKLEREPSLLPRARRELAGALAQLGDFELARAQPETGLDLYNESLSILEQLAAIDPANLGLQSDISVVSQQIADAMLSANKLEDALIWADKDLTISQRLAIVEDSETSGQRDLASSHDRRARILERLDRSAEALEDYGKGTTILEAAIQREDAQPSWQRDAAAMLESMGKLLGKTGQPERAIAAFRRALSIREGLAASFEEPSWQREVEAAYRRASELMLAMDRETEALETAEQYLLSTSLTPDSDDSKAEQISRALGTLCWSAVNARNFPRALWAGREAVELAPKLDWVRLNYAHALMFSGERDKARSIYLDGFSSASKDAEKWKDAIRTDFDKLRQRRLEKSLMVEISSRLGS